MNASTIATMLTGVLSLWFFSPSIAAEFSGTLKEVTITDSQSVNKPPIANFNYNVNGDTVSFDATISSDSDGVLKSFIWDFGDGVKGEGVSVIHQYNDLNVFPVTLTVVDNDNGVSLTQKLITLVQKYVSIKDDFNRPDGGLGNNWVSFREGKLEIVNGQIKNTISSKSGAALYTGKSFSSDQYCQLQIVNTSSSTIYIRYDHQNSQGYALSISSGNTKLNKISGTTVTQIGSTFTNPINENDIVKITVSAGDFQVYVNGNSIGMRVDDTYKYGSPGMGIYHIYGVVDNFEAGDI